MSSEWNCNFPLFNSTGEREREESNAKLATAGLCGRPESGVGGGNRPGETSRTGDTVLLVSGDTVCGTRWIVGDGSCFGKG